MNTKNLIIVESPSKIKTLKKYLGKEYEIEASVGHIRDLPKSKLGLDLEKGFKPTYEVSEDRSKKVVKHLKSVLKGIDNIYIATDPDREGEAIAWHLIDELKPKVPIKRMVFNEITKSAVQEALKDTRELDLNLVGAQECRRFLDRLFGFLVSKELWLNVKRGLSAGRVQSPAIKILVDREKQRSKFISNEYWSLEGNFKSNDGNIFSKLVYINDKKVATGQSFDRETGLLKQKNSIVLDKNKAELLISDASNNDWIVDNIEVKPKNQNPYPPFITSTLQQEGIRKLRMNSSRIMSVAQSLYENGYITYMRTDSIHLSNEALNGARSVISKKYGKDYLPDKPRLYRSKSKNAQEAHEAIRPAGATFKDPADLKNVLSSDEYKLYNMIWKRTVASQMNSAKIEQTKLTITDGKHIFYANGKTIVFAGFLRAYVEGSDNPADELDDMENILPQVSKGEKVSWLDINPKQHFTKPISRFTEASLVKELESLGIGRPSTYATIMKRIQDKGYVNNVKGSLIPTYTGYAIVQFLEKYYQDLVDLEYTSLMEDDLDQISLGKKTKEEYLNNFYYSNNGTIGLKDKLEQEYDKDLSRLIISLNDNDKHADIRIGRYGIYAEINNERVTIDENSIPSEMSITDIETMIKNKNSEPTELGTNKESGEPIVLKKGRFGPYLKSGDKMKSLPPGISEDDLDEDIAQQVIALPTELGMSKDGENVIIKDLGRYGPYIKCGSTNRKITAPDNILDLTLDRAIEILATSKSGTETLKDLGKHEDLEILVKQGRYGIYVTNGKVNVTLPKDKDYNTLDLATALDMIKNKKPKKRFFKRKK